MRQICPRGLDLSRCIADRIHHNAVPLSDVKLLDTVRLQFASNSTGHLTYDWAEAWVRKMKREQTLASSILSNDMTTWSR